MASLSLELPHGWTRVYDPETNKTYYVSFVSLCAVLIAELTVLC